MYSNKFDGCFGIYLLWQQINNIVLLTYPKFMYGSSIHKTLHVSYVIYFRVHSLSQSSHIDSHSPVAVYCTTLTRCAAKERDTAEVGDPMFA